MKMTRKSLILLAIVLFSTPVICGQDLSGYRKFSLGTSLAQVTKQVGPYSHWTTVIHQRPAVIQELTLWSLNPSPSRVGVDPVSQVLFSFYNGELYRIAVTYDRDATEGLTEEDMVQAVSARYGTGTRLYPEINLSANDAFAQTEEMIIARWEDSQNAVNLLRSSNMNSFRLAVFSKRLDAQAVAASTESVKLEKQEAPQKEIVGAGKIEKGKRVPLDVKVGDRILFGKYTGNDIKIDEQEYLILREEEILAKVSGIAKAASGKK